MRMTSPLAVVLVLVASAAVADPIGEGRFLSETRQLTFEGRRAGEGYFSNDGAMMVFQSERETGNPFYQIYLMDLETGDTRRLSPGMGKTTCAWIHPTGDRALFASTHADPEAREKQEAELRKRAEGKGRRYSWSFDPHYDIYQTPIGGGPLKRLTEARGYDAEGSWSPDGKTILFASNRHAYADPLSEADKALLAKDPSHFMELYAMDADGANVRRLTHAPGYDGGPFYSADGGKIVWRRFGEDGHSAEIYVMNADGTGEKAITALGALSWAPYFHLSGRYIIFGTSVQGFQNFELYMVDTEGNNDPVRVTETAGFDSLPVFSPDGATLSWTSSRTADRKPQIFLARWNHEAALAALGVDGATPKAAEGPDLPATQAKVRADDMRRHVEALASPAMEGRLTGSEGERLATDYVARAFARLGLAPAGDDGTYFQAFEFTSGVRLGTGNGLKISGADAAPVVEKSWRPLGLSANGSVAASPVVFAGYGIVAPAAKGIPAYDSYADLDVAGKWVMVLRYLPSGITQDRRRHMDRYAELNYKVAVARDRGAVGMIVVSGPASGVNEQLIPLHLDAAASGSGLAAITVTDSLAEALLAGAGKSLAALDQAVNDGEAVAGFALPDVALAAHIDLVRETATGRNALARLAAGDGAAAETVIVGAHVDHLGRGVEGKSRARPEERGQVHPGADDNASGVAGLLEIAEYLSDLKARGRLGARRDILFAAWSGEELGLLGSDHFVETLGAGRDSLRPEIAAYLNMDMIGRLDEQLILQGVGSSPAWRGEIERRNAPIGLSLRLDDSAFLPTDATSFYLKGVPILNAFTGPHDEYSTPRDRPETLNHEGAARIARFMGLVARGLAATESPPAYTAHKGPAPTFRRRTSRAYMGTIPDYAGAEGKGARLSGVSEGGPAAKAGLKAGDVVVRLAGKDVGSFYDYSYARDGLKAGEPVDVVVERGGARVTLTVTPESRE